MSIQPPPDYQQQPRTYLGAPLNVRAKAIHRRGISRERIDHPIPERPEDYTSGFHFDTVSSYGVQPTYSDSHPTFSGRSSPSNADSEATSQSWTAVSYHPGTTGNTTERSSTCSIGIEDEFDRQASKQVKALFQSIDSMLYEGQSGLENLQGECHEWVSAFPHLRILGKQLVAPQDLGFQYVETPRPASVSANLLTDITDTDISSSHAVHELSISGKHVDAQVLPPERLLQHLSNGSHVVMALQEEVIEMDGQVEDIIAVDYNPPSDDEMRNSQRGTRGKRGLPPVTPQACVKDNIAGQVFDGVWSETLSWLRLLLQEYTQLVVPDRNGDELNLALREMDINFPPSLMGGPMFPPSRESSHLSSSRVPQDKSRLGVSSGVAGSQEAQGGGAQLEGLLTISSKALQMRERSILHEPGEMMPAGSIPFGRPNSSMNQGRPQSVRIVEQQFQRMMSARQNRRGRLAPIERVKTPGPEEERILTNNVLRGHRMTTQIDRMVSPTLPFPRINALPPIGLVDAVDTPPPTAGGHPTLAKPRSQKSTVTKKKKSPPPEPHPAEGLIVIGRAVTLHPRPPRPKKYQVAPPRARGSKRHGSQRASSAVHQDAETHLGFYRGNDRMNTLASVSLENRPNTTHALYRSDTPVGVGRRSSTPLGFNTMRLTIGTPNTGGGAGSGGGGREVLLNITGSSINPQDAPPTSPPGPGPDLVEGVGGHDTFDLEGIQSPSRWERNRLAHNSAFRDWRNIEGANLNPQIRRPKQSYNMPVR